MRGIGVGRVKRAVFGANLVDVCLVVVMGITMRW